MLQKVVLEEEGEEAGEGEALDAKGRQRHGGEVEDARREGLADAK
jgi:hypothetical protein